MSNSFYTPQYVSIYVIHPTPKGKMYLLLHRSANYLKDPWQMVEGNIHENEKAYDAAQRELREKTGLIPDRLYCADTVETFYKKSIDKVVLIPIFVAFIDRVEADVKLLLNEYDNYEWAAYDIALDRLTFSEQKRALTHIDKNFVQNDPNPIHLIGS